jgi:hypothetical protein
MLPLLFVPAQPSSVGSIAESSSSAKPLIAKGNDGKKTSKSPSSPQNPSMPSTTTISMPIHATM